MSNNIKKRKSVSYSQFSKWMSCPFRYKLDYIDGKKIKEASINMCFGTAMHFVLQTYIESLYTKPMGEAGKINVKKLFKEKFIEELQKEKLKDENFKYTDEIFEEFSSDAINILSDFFNPKNILKHFPRHKYEFIGTELPLDVEIKYNLNFTAFIDLVMKERSSGKIKIWDFKTSTIGWNKYAKQDYVKASQVLLYKMFYSKKFNVPVENINVEFFILKRKLLENVEYAQSRIQIFEPINNKESMSESLADFKLFITECFTSNGEYNINGTFDKIPGKNKKNCKYCPHYKKNCDGKATK